MRRTISPVFLSLLALVLCGCGSPRPIRYYTVQLPMAPTPSTSTYPVSLLVASISGPQILQDTPIAYRVGANEIGTYQYSRWAEPPVEMIRGKLIRVLRASGDYQSVAAAGSASGGQFVVRGRLYEFEEVDSPGITGRVSMEFDLYDKKSGKVVWSHAYSHSEPVQTKEISAVVAALDLNLDRGLNEVAAGLNQYFSVNLSRKS
jgi:ABC-type uncharacterized transport system auxiliary subunit